MINTFIIIYSDGSGTRTYSFGLVLLGIILQMDLQILLLQSFCKKFFGISIFKFFRAHQKYKKPKFVSGIRFIIIIKRKRAVTVINNCVYPKCIFPSFRNIAYGFSSFFAKKFDIKLRNICTILQTIIYKKRLIQRSFPSLSISSNMKSISSSLVAGLDKMLLKIEI